MMSTGGLAQMVERSIRIREATGSIPVSSKPVLFLFLPFLFLSFFLAAAVAGCVMQQIDGDL